MICELPVIHDSPPLGLVRVTRGALWSVTVTVATHVELLLSASFAVSMMFVTPRGTAVPASGVCVTVMGPCASVARRAAVKSGTLPWQAAPAAAVWWGAQFEMAGPVKSIATEPAEPMVVGIVALAQSRSFRLVMTRPPAPLVATVPTVTLNSVPVRAPLPHGLPSVAASSV